MNDIRTRFLKCSLAYKNTVITFEKSLLALTGSPRPHGLISSSSRSAMWLMSVAIHPIRQIKPQATSPIIRAVTNTVFIIVGLLSFSLILQ